MNLVRLKGKLIGPAIIMLFGITSSYCQKIEISGIMRDIVTGDPIPEVSCEIIDKYSKDIYATAISDETGAFKLISPASERVLLQASNANFRTAKWTFKEINDKMFAKESDWFLSPRQVWIFDYFISFSKDSVQNIHLKIVEADNGALILYDSIRHVKNGLKLRLRKDINYEITMSAQDRFVRKWEILLHSNGDIRLKDWLNQPEEHYTFIDTFKLIPELNHQVRLTPIELNTTIELKGITYELGDDQLSREATRSLEKAIEIIKAYPELIFEIGNHSKDWNDPQKNLDLSISRAEIAANFIAEWGDLHKYSIASKGYGSYQMPSFCPGKEECRKTKQLEPHAHSITLLNVIGTRGNGLQKASNQRETPEVKKNTQSLPRQKDIKKEKIQFITAEYTGKALQVLYTSKLLPDGHPIFSEEGLFVDRRKIGGYSYLIPIPDRTDEGLFMKKYRSKYKDAFIVSYFKGERQ